MMKILGGNEPAPAELRGGALALGNFDGVHHGHQAVIASAMQWARSRGVPTLIATFDPHPARYFRPDCPPFTLTPLEQKLDIFRSLGLDAAVVIHFDAEVARMSAEDFCRSCLVERLGIGHVVTGADFTFGHQRGGNAQILGEMGRRFGFSTTAVSSFHLPGDVQSVSSTRVRALLASGEMEEAARLLSRPFTIRGRVCHGDKRGRTIGVPTANLELGSYMRSRYGVYAVRVRLPGGELRGGVANLGIRPMFTPPVELLETWIFDWSGDLYGQEIEVELLSFLRPEARFEGLDELKRQIDLDAQQARAALANAAAA